MITKYVTAVSLMLAVGSAHAADFYFPVTAGMANWSMAGDNWWYQDTHDHSIDRKSAVYSAGVGYKFNDRIRFEANYRYLKGGSIAADWESDANYYSTDASADHSVTNHGVSTWDVRGISLEALFDMGSFYVGGGPLFFREKWVVTHTEKGVDSPQHCSVDGKGMAFVGRMGVTHGKFFVEAARITQMKVENSGVEGATMINVGYNF